MCLPKPATASASFGRPAETNDRGREPPVDVALRQKTVSTQLRRVGAVLREDRTADQDDSARGKVLPTDSCRLDASHARHQQVEDDQIRLQLLKPLERL